MKSNAIHEALPKSQENGHPSWTAIFAAFPELHGMMTVHLDLPSIFAYSEKSGYRNPENLILMRLLHLHASSLPSMLSDGEKVVAILPCRLASSAVSAFALHASKLAATCEAVMVTTKKVIVAYKCRCLSSSAWLTIEKRAFFEALHEIDENRKAILRLSRGYAIVLPARRPSLSETVANNVIKEQSPVPAFGSHSSHCKEAISFKRLCPACFHPLTWSDDSCTRCGTKIKIPVWDLLWVFLLPGWNRIYGNIKLRSYLRIGISACLLAALPVSLLVGNALVTGGLCSILVVNHLSWGYGMYRLARLCPKPARTNKSCSKYSVQS